MNLLRIVKNGPMSLVYKYNEILLKRPLQTRIWTCFVLFGGAETLSQYIIHKKTKPEQSFDCDTDKVLKYSCFGAFNMAPFLHCYLNIFIDKLIPGATRLAVAKKILFDQLIMAPLMIHWFLFVLGLINGMSVNESAKQARENLMSTVIYGWRIWPLVSVLNFTIMPIHLRVLFVNVVSFFWTAFLSYQTATIKQNSVS